MNIIHTKKREEVLDTPVLLLECTLPDGSVERWCSHRVVAEGHEYEPRLLSHGDFHLSLAGEESLDSGSRFHLELSNVDGRISQIDRVSGWNGAKLRVVIGAESATDVAPFVAALAREAAIGSVETSTYVGTRILHAAVAVVVSGAELLEVARAVASAAAQSEAKVLAIESAVQSLASLRGPAVAPEASA